MPAKPKYTKELGQMLHSFFSKIAEAVHPDNFPTPVGKNYKSRNVPPKVDAAKNLQKFGRVTYYKTGDLTTTGTKPKAGYTAAISRDLLNTVPMGSIIELENGHRYRVEDRTADKYKGVPIRSTLDVFETNPAKGQGLDRNVPYKIVGKDTSGLKYNK